MPDREFIHSTIDVTSTLLFAFDSGFQVRLDQPHSNPDRFVLARADVVEIRRGQFSLFRPEWAYGPFLSMDISEGHNSGKYFVQPRTNHTAVTVSFDGERKDHGCRRFGN